MPSKSGHKTLAGIRRSDGVSWPALLASIGFNGLAWTFLVLIYVRAGDGLLVVAQPRTRIVWLKPTSDEPRRIAGGHASLQSASKSTPQRSTIRQVMAQTRPRSLPVAVAEAASPPSMPTPVDIDDVWTSNQQAAGGVKLGEDSAPLFRPDPLHFHRARDFPAQVARLKLRMRSAGGPAARAQMKVCGALLSQWEGMRMNASTDQAPLGMQPAGRQAVWRTLEARAV